MSTLPMSRSGSARRRDESSVGPGPVAGGSSDEPARVLGRLSAAASVRRSGATVRFALPRDGIEQSPDLPLIRPRRLDGRRLVVKRAMDIGLSTLAVLLTGPLILAIALAVKLTSKGPILYRQERVGYRHERFTILKFRTMRVDQPGDTVLLTPRNDTRVTPLGHFLRRTSLDELPQLWNVLRRDMSLVGPRPERPWVVEELRTRIPGYMTRHEVSVGLTGWAQVNGWRGDTSLERRIEHDLYYIENWSPLLDLKILWLTLWKGMSDRNAY